MIWRFRSGIVAISALVAVSALVTALPLGENGPSGDGQKEERDAPPPRPQPVVHLFIGPPVAKPVIPTEQEILAKLLEKKQENLAKLLEKKQELKNKQQHWLDVRKFLTSGIGAMRKAEPRHRKPGEFLDRTRPRRTVHENTRADIEAHPLNNPTAIAEGRYLNFYMYEYEKQADDYLWLMTQKPEDLTPVEKDGLKFALSLDDKLSLEEDVLESVRFKAPQFERAVPISIERTDAGSWSITVMPLRPVPRLLETEPGFEALVHRLERARVDFLQSKSAEWEANLKALQRAVEEIEKECARFEGEYLKRKKIPPKSLSAVSDFIAQTKGAVIALEYDRTTVWKLHDRTLTIEKPNPRLSVIQLLSWGFEHYLEFLPASDVARPHHETINRAFFEFAKAIKNPCEAELGAIDTEIAIVDKEIQQVYLRMWTQSIAEGVAEGIVKGLKET